MSEMIEFRWHGRGGQGAKTASLSLAEACFDTGKYIQGFPEYGPERMGAPIVAYNRISDDPITIHSNIYEPDYVVVVDDSLIDVVDTTAGIKDGGAVIVNSTKSLDDIKAKLASKGYNGKVYVVNAKKISEEVMGKYFPNTPTLGAVVKATGLISEDQLYELMEKSFKHKFANKPQVIEPNMQMLKRGYQEVQ